MSNKYYTLCGYQNGEWHPQFGDYDREVVEDEYHEYLDSGYWSAKCLKIISSGSTQDEINIAVSKLN